MKRTASIAFGSLLLVAPGEALARSRHFDNWVFGSGCTMTWDATLNRSIGARNTVLSTFEGTSTWSDPLTGALQLMTDGIQVFSSSNTEVTSAGTRLGGNPSAAQSGLVLPVPGQPGRYYVFAVPASQGTGNNGGLTVSKFNLTGANPVQESAVFTLNNGQLDIGEMLTVVANPNGRDYWVIATRATTNTNGEILVYNISTTALSNATAPARVVAVGGAGGGPNISRTGNRPVFGIAASPDGKRLAAATFEEVDLWDFNANTGDVTNGRVLRTSATTYHYGVAFSPDSSKLYVNGLYGTDAGRLMQFNLAAGNAFFDYGFLPAGNVGNGAGAMALGPDRRIYISTYAVGNKLSVIQNPNAAGAAAMYQANAVDVSAGCNTFFSLPTSINAFARLDALDPDADGDGIRDTQDADADGDGIPNRLELGGDDVAKDTDGDGVPDFKDKDQMGALCTDANTDGICDNIPVKYDTDGDGIPNHLDLDADNDGIPDLWENGGKALDANGDGRVDNTTDTDKDGLADVVDAAPADAANTTPKTTPVDSDGDGTLDAYELDSDGDGVFDIVETGQTDANRDGKVDGAFSDIDRDGLADAIDPDEGGSVKATLQDSDADGKADFQDTDDDGDTVLTKDELGAGGGANPVDTDGDGKRDYLDPDDDNDSILTKDEVADGKLAKVNKDDVDGDGKKNWLDDDADNDGKKDGVDGSAPRADDNGDGIPEYLQAAGATAEDSDGDGVPNTRETEIGTNPNNPDSDGDGVRDGDELGSGATPRDTDGDGKIDALDDDDDGDGVLTKQEIADAKAAGKSDDVDGDGKKNWLDNDADGDGVLDGAEASDSDGDGVPDYLIGLNGGASSSGDVNAPGSVEGGGCNTGGADANSLAPIALALVGLLRRRRTRR
jgi:uncharacterized protein (TIGR03382 family)